jgi:hypothetical protein
MIRADFDKTFPEALAVHMYDEGVVEIGDRLVEVVGEMQQQQKGGDHEDEDQGAAPRKVIVLSAPKGMGKSKAIRSMIRKMGSVSVLNVTFRRSLARGASSSLGPDSKVYLDEPDTISFHANSHPVLTILINSLLRVNAKRGGGYNVLILDEWVSILEMLGSEIIDDGKRVQISELLTEIARSARLIIVSDALLDHYSLVALRKMLLVDVVATDVSLMEFQHRNHADYHYHEHLKESEWMEELERAVLVNRRRVVVPCMTKSFALKITERLQKHLAPDRILCYVAGSEHDMVQHMADIDTIWESKDVVVYSPVITAGCSFEVRAHFDTCFLYAYQGTASVRSAIQMVSRVRDIRSKHIHVYIARCSQRILDSDTVIAQLIPHNPSLDPTTSADLHDATLVMRAVRAVDRVYCFRSAFWKLARCCGVQCHIKSEMGTEEEVSDLVDRIVGEMKKGGVKPLRTPEITDLFRLGIDSSPSPVWTPPPGDLRFDPFPAATGIYHTIAQEEAPEQWHDMWLRMVAQPERITRDNFPSAPPQILPIMKSIAHHIPVVLNALSPRTSWTIDPLRRILPHCHPLLRPLAASSDTVVYPLTGKTGISREDMFGVNAVRAHLAAALWCVMGGGEGVGGGAGPLRIILTNGTCTRFRERTGVFLSARTAIERMIHADRVPVDIVQQPSYLYEYQADPYGRLHAFDKEKHVRSRAVTAVDPAQPFKVLGIRPTDPTILPVSRTNRQETAIQALCCGTHVYADIVFQDHSTQSILVATTPLYTY